MRETEKKERSTSLSVLFPLELESNVFNYNATHSISLSLHIFSTPVHVVHVHTCGKDFNFWGVIIYDIF